MHARQIIREAVATIVTGLTTTGVRVYQSQVYNVQESVLPCLLVYTTSEVSENAQSIAAPRRIQRVLEVVIEAKHQDKTGLDDTLDDIAEEVEIAIGADPTLGVNAVDCVLASTDIEFSQDGDYPVGSLLMRYQVSYITEENAPGTLL